MAESQRVDLALVRREARALLRGVTGPRERVAALVIHASTRPTRLEVVVWALEALREALALRTNAARQASMRAVIAEFKLMRGAPRIPEGITDREAFLERLKARLLVWVNPETPRQEVVVLAAAPRGRKAGRPGGRKAGHIDEVGLPEPAQAADGGRTYRVWFGTDRKPLARRTAMKTFSSERDDRLHVGYCDVGIPRTHRFGSTGSPWWKRLFTRDDDPLRILGCARLAEEVFWTAIQARLAEFPAGQRQALVFIHGYNVGFADAAIRAAQIGVDLKVPVTGFYSWPSRGKVSQYIVDGASIEGSEQPMAEFLARFALRAQAEQVHILAHSMGNRGLLRSLHRIVADASLRSGVQFGQIFLAAPDVDAGLFGTLAHVYEKLARRTTLYVSPRDRAVHVSQTLHGAARIGFSPPVTIVPPIETVEVPDFDVDLLGHGYYASAEGVLHDMFDLLARDAPPSARQRLEEAFDGQARRYWRMVR